MLVQPRAVGQLRRAVEDGGKAVLGEELPDQGCVADVALNAGEARDWNGCRIGVDLEVEVDDRVPLTQQSPLQHAAKEAGAPGDEHRSRTGGKVSGRCVGGRHLVQSSGQP